MNDKGDFMGDSTVTGEVEVSVTETVPILVDDTMGDYAVQLIAERGFMIVLLCIITVVVVSIIKAVIHKLSDRFNTAEIKRPFKRKKK